MEERRQHERIARSHRVTFQWSYTDEQGILNSIECKTLDVSRQGLRITSDQILPVGLDVNLCIESDEGQLWLLFAKVQWSESKDGSCETGFSISDLSTEDFERWAKHTRAQLSS